jgi:hypothetical protein
MIIFKNGKAVDVMIGAMSKGQMDIKIKHQISSGNNDNNSLYRY